MNLEHAARVVAAFAAVLIVIGPYAVSAIFTFAHYVREQFLAFVAPKKEWSVPFSTKAVFASFLAYVAISGSPQIGTVQQRGVQVSAPDSAMKQKVAAVSIAMRNAATQDRINWADVWMKAAAVVAGEATSSEVVFTDTRSLRAFTVISLEIGWRRLGGNTAGKYPGLRESVEAAFKDCLTDEIKPVTKDMRDNYVALAKAIAWAGMAKE